MSNHEKYQITVGGDDIVDSFYTTCMENNIDPCEEVITMMHNWLHFEGQRLEGIATGLATRRERVRQKEIDLRQAAEIANSRYMNEGVLGGSKAIQLLNTIQKLFEAKQELADAEASKNIREPNSRF